VLGYITLNITSYLLKGSEFMKKALRLPLLLAATCIASVCAAGEVPSPEEFLSQTYGWTIKGLDSERGLFGKFRNFACYDDRLGPPKTDIDLEKRRWGTQCTTKRGKGENLAAMIFISWVNKRHLKPVSAEEYADSVAQGMAGGKDAAGFEAKCAKSPGSAGGKSLTLYDCSMVLPFGTFFANFVQFEHRGIEFFVRAQNASNTPSQGGPRDTMGQLVSSLTFADER
jgi:hypothetical protein